MHMYSDNKSCCHSSKTDDKIEKNNSITATIEHSYGEEVKR